MFKKPPAAEDLNQVPDAQQPMRDNSQDDQAAYRGWAKEVSKGVDEIIRGPRGKGLTMQTQRDLVTCLDLLDGTTSLPFDWDITMYTNPPPLNATRMGKSALGDKTVDPEGNVDDDDEDLDSVERPQWSKGEVHIVKLPAVPFWTMARYVYAYKRVWV